MEVPLGIRLDWEVENESWREAVTEDASTIAAQKRKQQITRRALIAIGALVLIGGLIANWRITQVRQQRRDALEATVQSETLALRLGDSRKFMLLQGAAEEWRAEQRRNFEALQTTEPGITVTDEILDVVLQDDEAKVSVRVLIGAVEDKAVWLYGYTAEKGWRHIGTEAEPWAIQIINGNGYSIEYHLQDAPLADDIDGLMKGWWNTATAFTSVDKPPQITVVLDQHAAFQQWQDEAQSTLIVPARKRDGSARIKLEGGAFGELASALADRWTAHTLRDVTTLYATQWVDQQTRLFIGNLFDPSHPRAEFFGRLNKAFGANAVPAFFKALRKGHTPNEALMIAMAGAAPAPEDIGFDYEFNEYLSNYLQAEVAFTQLFMPNSHSMTELGGRQVFSDGDAPLAGQGMEFEYGLIEPDSIQVQSTKQIGDVMWARLSYAAHSYEAGSNTVKAYIRYEPFTATGGYWRHTYATLDDYGPQIAMNSANVIVIARSIDVSIVNSDLVGPLDVVYQQVAKDFGIDVPGMLAVNISPFATPNDNQFVQNGAAALQVNVVSLHSPRAFLAYMATDDYYYQMAGRSIVNEVFGYVGKKVPGITPQNWIGLSLVRWEERHIGLDIEPMQVNKRLDVILPETLDDIWAEGSQCISDATCYQMGAEQIGSQVLVDLLMERYGITALPKLAGMISGVVPGAPPYATIDDWLHYSLNITSADIDLEWRVRYANALVDAGYLPRQ